MSAPRRPVVRVRVPASSANLGPGFDVMAAALDLHLDLRLEPAGEFALRTRLQVARGRSNLLVRAFETLEPADGWAFHMSSTIPLSGGLGSSAAAVVAGLLAADAVRGGDGDVLARAAELEGHADNVAAALLGGGVVCGSGPPARIPMPPDLAGVLVVPSTPVRTREARAALPESVPLADAVFNVSRASALALGLATGDLDLVARGLADRLHQPYRAALYPRSAELLGRAGDLGALGATISGAGPTVLLWCERERARAVADRAREHARDWAQVLAVSFEDAGAQVSRS